jgi:O-Antigen ligase
MGLFLTLLYLLIAYIGPQTIFGPIAEYHIEIVIAFLALVASLPSLHESTVARLPQTYAVIGMSCAVFISYLLNGLTGLAPEAVFNFLPNSFTFLFIVLNCKKKKHLQMVILVLLFACLFTIYRGYSALQSGNFLSPYLVGQQNDVGTPIYRIRGLSFINDPNDFSQLIVSLIPCLFLFWKPRKLPRNILFVIFPIGILLFGMFLTHSRGAIVAFLAVVIIAGRRKIGTVPSLILAGVLFVGATAVGWSGGREVSVEAGAGRMEAWAVGLDLIKAHPIFGVGFQRFGEYFEITAHNSIVVCAAELGMFGLFFWVMFVFPTLRDALVVSALPKSKEQQEKEDEEKNSFQLGFPAQPAAITGMADRTPVALSMKSAGTALADRTKVDHQVAAAPFYMDWQDNQDELSNEEVHRIARLLMISLSGFLVAGWFLSRAYVMTLYIYGGMIEVVYRLALEKEIVRSRMPFPKVLRLSAIGAIGLLFVVYIMLRIQHLMPK